ncbi:hypothetical protein P43SY_006729 [Pythium insidiosum]|uniref:Uncharacterized protein n=1 Tax=Pythium insidiosum TaxID=114742 RepID=A0AAD5LQH4_PYTIN|nr:hypothetical protein P43SY_006729 [Pythium insidiosum]
MGNAKSKAVEQTVRATALQPLQAPVPILGARHCLESARTFLVRHKTRGSEMTVSVYDYANETRGARAFQVNGTQLFFTVCGAEDSDAIVRVRPVNQVNFAVETPAPTLRETTVHLYTLKRMLKENTPVTIGVVKDQLTGHSYRLGYTGVWKYGVVIWLASEKTPDCPTTIAKTYPSHRGGIQVSYCLEVVEGVDMAALMTMIAVLDMGPYASSPGLGASMGVMG